MYMPGAPLKDSIPMQGHGIIVSLTDSEEMQTWPLTGFQPQITFNRHDNREMRELSYFIL